MFIDQVLQQLSDEYIAEREVQSEDPLVSAKALLKQNEENRTFHNRSKQQLDKLKKKPIFKKAYIRIKFPDNAIIQGCFAPSETLQDIYAYVTSVKLYFYF